MVELKHVFFVPCDSHGIQLLVKDLLEIPVFKDIMAKAQTVVKSERSGTPYCSMLAFENSSFNTTNNIEASFYPHHTLGNSISPYLVSP